MQIFGALWHIGYCPVGKKVRAGGSMAELNLPKLWRKSSRCDTSTCVEIAFSPERERIYLRSSRNLEIHLEFSAEAWRAFCAAAAAGELDQPATGAG
jgi:hypothetical protein